MSDKQQFFDSLKEIEQFSLFLTDSADQLDEEIQTNCIQLSIPSELQITGREIIEFLNRVKLNRQAQLQNSSLKNGLIHYLWHDEQAGQLRFNFISVAHQKLPFGCAIFLVESEEEIVADFLSSNYLQGISWEEFTDASAMPVVAEVATEEAFTLKVYQEIIFRSSAHHTQSLR
jgi:hypothetical protein